MVSENVDSRKDLQIPLTWSNGNISGVQYHRGLFRQKEEKTESIVIPKGRTVMLWRTGAVNT